MFSFEKMDIENIKLVIIKYDQSSQDCVLQINENENGLFTLILTYEGISINATSETCFEALKFIRAKLEKDNLLLKCYGSCVDVYPSPMILSMGDGRLAYRLTPGKPASNNDLVDIFDSDEGIILAKIDEQEKYYNEWLRSIIGN